MTQGNNYGIPSALTEALEPPHDGSPVSSHTAVITPEDAEEILKTMAYERQRGLSAGHVGMLADMMIDDDFAKRSQISFALDETGSIVLVDGQHRLKAAATANWTDTWSVRMIWDKTAEQIYTTMDTSVKQRTGATIGKSAGFKEFSPRLRNIIIPMARYQNIWRSEYQQPDLCNTPPVRDNIERAKSRLESLTAVDEILAERRATTQIKRRLASPMVTAVMAETLHMTPDEAKQFWVEVATNGEGIAGELRAALIEGRPPKAAVNYMARLAAHAWNQRHSTGRLRRENRNDLKVPPTSFVIPA